MEFCYQHSVRSTKYISFAILVSAIGLGGICNLLPAIMDYNSLYSSNYTVINKVIHWNYRLDWILYPLSGLALLSLIVTSYLINRFKLYFVEHENCSVT